MQSVPGVPFIKRLGNVMESVCTKGAQKAQAGVALATHDDLKWADGIIWGIPTRYGSMPAQMKQFLDSAGGLWANGELEGKATAVFTSSGSIHGGQESTVLTSLVPLLNT